MNDTRMRFIIGVFVLSTMVLLAVLITLFGGFPSVFTHQSRYAVVLPSAPGVGPGTPVRRSGVRIGEVESVELDEKTGQVRVYIQVSKKLWKKDRPALVRSLLGDTTIDFGPRPQNGDAPELEPGAELVGETFPDAQVLLNQATDVLPSTRDSLNELRKSAQNFNKMAPDIARTNDEIRIAAQNWGKLGERADVLLQTNQEKLVKTLEDMNDTLTRIGRTFSDENQRNLSATLKNVKNSSDSLGSVTQNTDELLKEVRQTIKRVNESLKETDQVMANLQQATKPMAERSDRIMKNLDESTDKLNKTLTDVRELMRAMSQGDGTVQRLLRDPALYNNLNDAACMITRMLPRVDRALRDLEVFADKIARHPESLGVGGAVRPSGGLK